MFVLTLIYIISSFLFNSVDSLDYVLNTIKAKPNVDFQPYG